MKKRLLISLMLISISTISFSQVFWQEKVAGGATNRAIQQISYADANNIWANYFDGAAPANVIREFTKSTDGGNTWTNGVINVGGLNGLGSIEAISGTTAFVCTTPVAGNLGGVYKTVDSGANWIKQPTATFTGADAFPDFVTFWDANEGIVVGDPNPNNSGPYEIYRTLNGGVNWTRVPTANIPPAAGPEAAYTRVFERVDNALFFGTSTGRIYRSIDKGVTWTVNSTPLTDFSGAGGGKFSFKDENNGILIPSTFDVDTTIPRLYTTTDGGVTWIDRIPNGPIRRGTNSFVKGTVNTYVSSGIDQDLGTGGSSYSIDGGLNWIDINTLGDAKNINNPSWLEFFDNTQGLASGVCVSTSVGGIFKYVGTQLPTIQFSSDKLFTVSPNPTSDKLNLTGENINQVQITDLLGKVVLNNIYATLSNVELNIAEFNSGIYMVKVTNNEGKTSVVKVVKQ